MTKKQLAKSKNYNKPKGFRLDAALKKEGR